VTSSPDVAAPLQNLVALLPQGWTAETPGAADAPALTDLLRRHEEAGRGWPGASEADVLVDVDPEHDGTRENVVVRDAEGRVLGWCTAHDRAAGRMLVALVVERRLDRGLADRVAELLFGWADEVAGVIGARRGLDVQQVDSGAFADDDRQHAWLERAGFTRVRTWWQMSRPVAAGEALDAEAKEGVRIRRVRRQGTGMPDEDDLRTVHDVLESAFADHFNSHEESFDEFLSRLREDPGHRWDHWWIAELVDGDGDVPEPAGALVGAVVRGDGGHPDGSYVEYIGVLQNARGRGVAKSLLQTIVADAAERGRDSVGLEVDADSPTGADQLYVSMGWQTKYTTESWHRDVPVTQS